MTAQPNTQSHQRSLVDGPSKFDLMLALFDKDKGRKVSFTDEHGMKYEASISMVESEDGSGESWNLKGSTTIWGAGGKEGDGKVHLLRYHFIGYFRTDRRKGHLIFK